MHLTWKFSKVKNLIFTQGQSTIPVPAQAIYLEAIDLDRATLGENVQ